MGDATSRDENEGLDEGDYRHGFAQTASGVFRILPPLSQRPSSPMDLVCRRISAGLRQFSYQVSLPNVLHPGPSPAPICHHHLGPATLSWGRKHPAVHDLALNVMAAYLPLERGEPSFRCEDGSLVSARAHRHHHAFASEFLELMPKSGGVIPERDIRAWVRFRKAMPLDQAA